MRLGLRIDFKAQKSEIKLAISLLQILRGDPVCTPTVAYRINIDSWLGNGSILHFHFRYYPLYIPNFVVDTRANSNRVLCLRNKFSLL